MLGQVDDIIFGISFVYLDVGSNFMTPSTVTRKGGIGFLALLLLSGSEPSFLWSSI